MPRYKRLIAQVHDIEAACAADADEIARIRAAAANEAMRDHGNATVWAPSVSDPDIEDGGLLDILEGVYLYDEVDDNPERNPRLGYVPVEGTTVPERLLAWRDTALHTRVRALLDTVQRALANPDERTGALYRLRDAAEALCADPAESTRTRFEPVPDPGGRYEKFPWVLRDNATGQPHVPAGGRAATGYSSLAGAWDAADRLNRSAEAAASWDEPLPGVVLESAKGGAA